MNQAPESMFDESSRDDYDNLPEPVKFVVSRKDYLWLSDEAKARLIQDECEPEY